MNRIVPLKENHLFSKVYAKGKKSPEKYVVVYALQNYRDPRTLLGITTSKKIGGAVQRSRARRLIREAYRAACKDREFSRPYLIVVVARRRMVEDNCKMDCIHTDLAHAFSRLNLFKDERAP